MMSGNTNFPSGLDTDSSLFDVADGVNTVQAAHHNNLKEAIKAMQLKIGINNTLAPTTLDYRLGHPTDGHRHDGASGHGPPISPTTLVSSDSKFRFVDSSIGVVLPKIATSAINATLSEEGQAYYDTANDKAKLYTGATWRSLAFE
jgi:hypothetical protein